MLIIFGGTWGYQRERMKIFRPVSLAIQCHDLNSAMIPPSIILRMWVQFSASSALSAHLSLSKSRSSETLSFSVFYSYFIKKLITRLRSQKAEWSSADFNARTMKDNYLIYSRIQWHVQSKKRFQIYIWKQIFVGQILISDNAHLMEINYASSLQPNKHTPA